MKNEEYKKLSIKEFTKATGRYESSHAGIYEMCKKDYPNPQAFFDSVKRCLRPNGRLVLRDVTSDNKVLVWLRNCRWQIYVDMEMSRCQQEMRS